MSVRSSAGRPASTSARAASQPASASAPKVRSASAAPVSSRKVSSRRAVRPLKKRLGEPPSMAR